jgi:hypothetical protein
LVSQTGFVVDFIGVYFGLPGITWQYGQRE